MKKTQKKCIFNQYLYIDKDFVLNYFKCDFQTKYHSLLLDYEIMKEYEGCHPHVLQVR